MAVRACSLLILLVSFFIASSADVWVTISILMFDRWAKSDTITDCTPLTDGSARFELDRSFGFCMALDAWALRMVAPMAGQMAAPKAAQINCSGGCSDDCSDGCLDDCSDCCLDDCSDDCSVMWSIEVDRIRFNSNQTDSVQVDSVRSKHFECDTISVGHYWGSQWVSVRISFKLAALDWSKDDECFGIELHQPSWGLHCLDLHGLRLALLNWQSF